MALIDDILAANAQAAVQGQQVQSDIAQQALSGVPSALAALVRCLRMLWSLVKLFPVGW